MRLLQGWLQQRVQSVGNRTNGASAASHRELAQGISTRGNLEGREHPRMGLSCALGITEALGQGQVEDAVAVFVLIRGASDQHQFVK